MKETLSITKALVELKTLSKRIEKKTIEFAPFAILKGGKLPEYIQSRKEFEEKAKADLQSIRDLCERRAKIKSAVVQSNAITRVQIAGEKLTIAEAIERKSSIDFEKSLSKVVAQNYSANIEKVERHNHSLKSQLLKLLEATYSKSESQISKDDHDRVAIPFLKSNEAKLLDPVDSKKLYESLDENITAFEAEVDVTLSESNARTDITI